ncbi:sec-independent protein translocase protein TatB [Devosia enhydra]|uniref:Sec-independent protein translocase protein TatB n=1 Tax=Devosia enhydra TaxID=665118 RepID=A0A1K2HWF4_9HYPH|nr:Sec-independent protein translocase protein TatB [Devosia enhydra]SFZ82366.1 sec-independent protein translocase protein TatB [Devosia enhydra]
MLGFSWTEMMVIGVVALIVIGPKDLPVLMNKAGKFVAMIRKMGADFQREINRSAGLDEVRNIRTTITNPLKATAESIRKEFNTTTPSGKVEPSGAIKPADPNAQSVVNEIRQAAGMAPVMAAGKPLPRHDAALSPVEDVPNVEVPRINAVVAPPPTVASDEVKPEGAPAKAGAATDAATSTAQGSATVEPASAPAPAPVAPTVALSPREPHAAPLPAEPKAD